MDVREKLLNAALEVFQEAGSRGATTRRIAQAAGVNEITLFRHFGSKSALIHEALRAAMGRMEAARLPDEPRDPAGELTVWCRAHHAHLMGARAMIRTAMGEFDQEPVMGTCAADAPARFAVELAGYLGRLRERGMADAAVEPSVAATMLMGALFSDAMGRDVMPQLYTYAPEEAPERYVALFLRAIGARPAHEAHTPDINDGAGTDT
ncbi:MAG: acnR [Gemmatimonadetes bacterium]|nr:acnR [Gemmatimonadota bacterium]